MYPKSDKFFSCTTLSGGLISAQLKSHTAQPFFFPFFSLPTDQNPITTPSPTKVVGFDIVQCFFLTNLSPLPIQDAGVCEYTPPGAIASGTFLSERLCEDCQSRQCPRELGSTALDSTMRVIWLSCTVTILKVF